MKVITFCLMVLLLFLPTYGFGQATSQSSTWHKPEGNIDWDNPAKFLGVRVQVALTTGQIAKGKLIGWQIGDTEVSLKDKAPSVITREQAGTAHLKLEQKKVPRIILFSEVREVLVKPNFFQKLGTSSGLIKVGNGLRNGFGLGVLAIIYGIDWTIHGGKPKGEYP